jgi:hypothetical protein
MPELRKTLIVPSGNPEPIFASDTIKFVVIGNRTSLVKIADNLAINPPFTERAVVWFVNGLPAKYAGMFGIANPGQLKAFSLSTNNTVGATMSINDIEDYPGVDNMYHQAG